MTMAWLSCVQLMAQRTFEVSGTVVDKTTGEAVVGGSIKLLALPDSGFVTGTTTGQQGGFVLKDVRKGMYALKVSYIGMETKCMNLDFTAQKKKKVDIGYITMVTDAVQLQGVEVTAHAAKVQVSGDSLVYNAAAYRVPEGSTLEALVKQLPGAKVDKEGNITINGKTVSKILVDGKEFFLNDKAVAMKNIPTEMIDKLKTYDRKSDLSRVTGIDDGEEETVLDLTVKKGMKNGWYGNVNVGAMTSNKRLTGNFRMEWKPDTMTNIIFRPNLTYQLNRGMGHSTSASYSANPNDTIISRLADIMV